MLDIRLIREQPERVIAGLGRMGVPREEIETIRAIDAQVRALKTEVEQKRHELNAASKALGRLSPEEREQKRAELRQLGDTIAALDAQREELERQLHHRMLLLPNIPDERVPDGTSEADNVIVRTWGTPRTFTFPPKPHWEIGAQLGILDIERGIKISGSRFYVLRGAGAALQRALITFMLDLHIYQHKHLEVYPPFMVKQECLIGTGQLPKFAENLYHDAEEDYWFVPTAEVPVTNLHREEILEASQLPLRYVAYTPCFRREKMSAGRDVRGIKRGHQFDKVEMVRFCAPEDSDAELEIMLQEAEEVCQKLELPYRVVLVCTGEKGEFNAIQYDIEVYAPASKGEEGGEWLEVSSCSNFRDFQARRANIRYRPAPGAKPEFVHTLNGSGLALPRVLIAILENYQNEDGSVTIPPILRPYLHGLERIEASS
ncbi:serine--tRNA ligase [Chthonomonas calidirosea]|uniref:Serine--tRNA ligase n=1 Tax=Chthonomonas calidirosea (strain DSM 23976 / ICMP 18418 / T49) TaxID=1303518 RepID=S0EWC5_CHTCT|nr:serine--tRNA ligase [Chthonomonas calidirosea]CCW33983.1 seryl-tRNA synthetase [Chthonomonas calidirosea T49]CEK14976.1 seryl-tRNA synthetase [Chthonomonas calidirosea]CEK16100.1 seryl-tRNA synthetase [Chthonomonas calidirosea]